MTAPPDAPLVVVQPDPRPHVVSLALRGDLDYDTGDEVLDAVRRALSERPDARALLLDCRGLADVDSTGLSVLLQVHRLAARREIGFRLENPPSALERLLTVTGTLEHLTSPAPALPSAETGQAASESPGSGA